MPADPEDREPLPVPHPLSLHTFCMKFAMSNRTGTGWHLRATCTMGQTRASSEDSPGSRTRRSDRGPKEITEKKRTRERSPAVCVTPPVSSALSLVGKKTKTTTTGREVPGHGGSTVLLRPMPSSRTFRYVDAGILAFTSSFVLSFGSLRASFLFATKQEAAVVKVE